MTRIVDDINISNLTKKFNYLISFDLMNFKGI